MLDRVASRFETLYSPTALAADRQPPAADRRFDEIGWAADLRTAIKLGKEHNRPIFLFTMDGRINTGRC